MIFITVLHPCEKKISVLVFRAITHLTFLASVLGWVPGTAVKNVFAVGTVMDNQNSYSHKAEGRWLPMD